MPIKNENIESLNNNITNCFIWTYKKGDNIVYNFKILWALFEAKKHYKFDKTLYNKPISIIIVSIIECILEDFVRRIQGRTQDPLPNISSEIIHDFKYKICDQKLELKQLSKFNHYIDMVKKHSIFGLNKNNYLALEILRDTRNKVHIQDSSEDECGHFTETNLRLSEKVLEGIMKSMIIKYPRSADHIFSQAEFDLMYPWKNL